MQITLYILYMWKVERSRKVPSPVSCTTEKFNNIYVQEEIPDLSLSLLMCVCLCDRINERKGINKRIWYNGMYKVR